MFVFFVIRYVFCVVCSLSSFIVWCVVFCGLVCSCWSLFVFFVAWLLCVVNRLLVVACRWLVVVVCWLMLDCCMFDIVCFLL